MYMGNNNENSKNIIYHIDEALLIITLNNPTFTVFDYNQSTKN